MSDIIENAAEMQDINEIMRVRRESSLSFRRRARTLSE